MPLLPSSKKRFGYKPDEEDERDKHFDTLGLSVADNDKASLEEYVPVVLDQGNTNSCVANAFASGIHIMEAKAGLDYMPVSRLFLYYNARRVSGAVLFDNGTYLRNAAKVLHRLGVCDEKHWKFSSWSGTVNKRPPLRPAFMRAHPRRGGEYVKIFELYGERTQAVMAAVEAGFPVAFGTNVTQDFTNGRGPLHVERPSSNEKFAGGHAMLIVGYKYYEGQTWFRVLNSWGTGWRDDGYCWISDAYLQWSNTRDLHVIHGWERLQESS